MSSKEKKAAAAAEEAKKIKKFYTKCIIFVVVLAIVVAASAFITSDYRTTKTTALEVGGTKYSPVEFSYYYRSVLTETYNKLSQSYGDLTGYLLDTTVSLEEQTSIYGDGTQTWAQYFYDQAIVTLTNLTVLYDAAVAEGYTLDETSLASIESDILYYSEAATQNGYPTLDSFLADTFGQGFDEELLRDIAQKQYLASAYSADISNSFEYTAEELDAYYMENADTFDFITYHMYFVGTSADAFADMSDDEKVAAAHEAALTIADAASGAQFAKNVYNFVDEDAKSSYSSDTATMSIAQGGNLGSVYADWLLDASRVEGDTTVIDSDGGSYAVMFISRNDNHYNLVDARHILITAEADENGAYSDEAVEAAKAEAERIYALWQEDPTEENFAALAGQYSEDQTSASYGGLYEDIYKNAMVSEFDSFLFEEGKKPGDTAVVYGTNGSYVGYHVVYFSAEGDLFSEALADYAKRGEDYNAKVGAMAQNYELVIGKGMKHVDLA